MSVAIKRSIRVLQNNRIEDGIYDMWLEAEDIVADATPGQFISLYCNEGGRMLPRPISICEINRKDGTVRLVYRVIGKGTDEFSRLKAGDSIECMVPLGRLFTLERSKAIIVGG